MLADYRQVYDPLGNSLGLSSVVAALPLVTLFVLLGVVRMRAWLASLIRVGVGVPVVPEVNITSIGASSASASLRSRTADAGTASARARKSLQVKSPGCG